MNITTLTPEPEMEKTEKKMITTHKKSVKKQKHRKRSDKSKKSKKNKKSKKSKKSKSKKRSGNKSKKHKSGKKHRNPYEYNIENQIGQFYEMTLKHLSSEQKGFLNVVNNSIVFNKGGKGSELYLRDLEKMPWWTFKLTDVKQKLPIASPLLVGPVSFEMIFKQADKNSEIKRFLSIQNGNLYLVKDQELNAAFL